MWCLCPACTGIKDYQVITCNSLPEFPAQWSERTECKRSTGGDGPANSDVRSPAGSILHGNDTACKLTFTTMTAMVGHRSHRWMLVAMAEGRITWWTAKEALMPAPFTDLPCSYSRRTDGPIPCRMQPWPVTTAANKADVWHVPH